MKNKLNIKSLWHAIKTAFVSSRVVRCADVYFECRFCRYRITETEKTNARFDYKCPRCGRVTISEFYKV